MSVTSFAAFTSGFVCALFIDSEPMIEIARAASKVKMALAVVPGRRKEWEDAFMKKLEVLLDSEVGLPKMIGAFCVMVQCELDVERVGSVQPVPNSPSQWRSGGIGIARAQATS